MLEAPWRPGIGRKSVAPCNRRNQSVLLRLWSKDFYVFDQKGGGGGSTRYPERHAERATRALSSEHAIERRHVADDDGDSRAAGLEGSEAFLARWQHTAECCTRAVACSAIRRWPERGAWRWSTWRWPRWRARQHPRRWFGRPARRRRGRQRDLGRSWRSAPPVPAERPGRHRQFLGRQGPEPADLERRSRERTRLRSARPALHAKRHVARPIARRAQPISSAGGRPSDAGRTAAGR